MIEELKKDEMMTEALSNNEILDSVFKIATNKDFFVAKGDKKTNLADCLADLSDDVIDMLYTSYQTVLMKNKNLKDLTNRKEKEEKLKQLIPECFKDYGKGIDYAEIKTIETLLINKAEKDAVFDFLCDGFAYQYRKDNNDIFVLPAELATIYQELKDNGVIAKRVEETGQIYFSTYLLINGIVKKTVMYDILVNHHKLPLTEEKMESFFEKELDTPDYYSLGGEELVEQLAIIKNEKSYLRFTDAEINNYFEFITSFMKKLRNLLNNNHKNQALVYMMMLLSSELDDEEINALNLSKKEIKAVQELLEEYESEIRYWCYDGRTIGEADFLAIAEDVAFKKKLTPSTIENCLANVDELYYDEALSKDDVLENLGELSDKHIYIKHLANLNNKSIYEIKESFDYFSKGLIFFYHDGDDIKCLVPDEVLEAIENKDDDVKDQYLNTLVTDYLEMNAVLRKEKLQELLKSNAFTVDIKELDKLVKDNDYYILNDNYYSIFDEMDDEDLGELLKTKDKFSKYKPADLANCSEEFDFYEKLWELVNTDISDNKDELFNELRLLAKNNGFSKSNLEELAYNYGINLSVKVKDKLLKLYNNYKDSIGIWEYNGYTATEYLAMKKETKKVGRNEPCPCGSGLKYKKCCGK